jgi:hypothetical protein
MNVITDVKEAIRSIRTTHKTIDGDEPASQADASPMRVQCTFLRISGVLLRLRQAA